MPKKKLAPEVEAAQIVAQADAEWTADPGTPPDMQVKITRKQTHDDPDIIAKALASLSADGATFFRHTETFSPDAIWFDGWIEQPAKMAEFEMLTQDDA